MAIQIRKIFGTETDFLNKVTPDVQLKIGKDPHLCIFGDFPTLIDISIAYDKSTPIIWLVPQLVDFSEYCGCKEKLSKFQIKQCATIIANEYGHLKITEIMLFLYRAKTGRYGKMYGAVDPITIIASLRIFLQERNSEYEKNMQKLREEKYQRERRECISYEEYTHRLETIHLGSIKKSTEFERVHESERDMAGDMFNQSV